ncbi:MAG: DNA phosphorothioation-associated putative methyltransferase [Verrucomicrobiales bacterium]
METPASPRSLAAYQEVVASLPFGKKLPTAVYVLDGSDFPVPESLRTIATRLRDRLGLGPEFNVLKWSTRELRLSFLAYPSFAKDAHPALDESVSVDLASGKVRRTSYAGRANPPILHRKETFLPDGHPDARRYRRLTAAEEAAGLYEETATIGFRRNWEALLRSKGLAIRGYRLVDLQAEDGDAGEGGSGDGSSESGPGSRIDRHRTALARSDLSMPVKSLLENDQLRPGDRIFDYGCGLGDDVAGLEALGYDATGWDPHFAPRAEKREAEVVNLGFVLNVIEDPAERVEVLVDAWRYTRRILAVSTLMAGRENYAVADPFEDGLVTVRNTFQKHFEPGELAGVIEHALHAEPVPVELGLCYVFRRIEDQQDFLSLRTRRCIDWEQIHQRLRILRPSRVRRSVYDRHPDLLEDFWKTLLQLGRLPKPGEYKRLEELRAARVTPPQAARLFVEKYGESPLKQARERRKEDLLVYLAAGEFQKRRTPFSRLSSELKADIKAFFGHYSGACDEARDILFASGDSDEIEEAIADLDFGWFDASQGHFTVHRSLLDRLPAILRIYIECAARLYGDPRQADLIKLHVYSGKLTFLHFDDFDGKALPELETRLKVDLRRLFVLVVDHGEGPAHQILFFKERFLAADHPGREAMERYSRRLRKLGITEDLLGPNDQGAPSREEFESALDQVGLTRGLARKPKSR